AKAVRLQDLRTRPQILPMHLPDHVRLAQRQLVIATVDVDATRVEHRAHGAVEDGAASVGQPVVDGHGGYCAWRRPWARGPGPTAGGAVRRSTLVIMVVSMAATWLRSVSARPVSCGVSTPKRTRSVSAPAVSAAERRAIR